jgi:hypothetical protein
MHAERNPREHVAADPQPEVVFEDLRKRNERRQADSRALEAQRRRRIDLIVEVVRRRRPDRP